MSIWAIYLYGPYIDFRILLAGWWCTINQVFHLPNCTHLYLSSSRMTWCYYGNYWLLTCDSVEKLPRPFYLLLSSYVGLRFVLLSVSLFHCILLSVIPYHIHNEKSLANMLFWAVHKLGCHIIFQSWTWRWWDIVMGVWSLRNAVRVGHRCATTSEKHLHSSTLKYVNMVGVERWGYLFIMKVTDV